MPITPLHFGVLAPINHFFPGRFNNVSFILATLWMDALAIRNWAFGYPLPDHVWQTHSFLGAGVTALFIGLLGIRLREPFVPAPGWISGAVLGAVSHVALDMLVHPEMIPLYPYETNPFYMGWMEPLSWLLVPLCIWLTFQYVSGILGWVRKRLGASPADSL